MGGLDKIGGVLVGVCDPQQFSKLQWMAKVLSTFIELFWGLWRFISPKTPIAKNLKMVPEWSHSTPLPPKSCKLFQILISLGIHIHFCWLVLSFEEFVEAVFCADNSGALAPHPQDTSWPNLTNCARVKASELHLVATGTSHCLGYFPGTDVVKLSWQTKSKFCKKKRL